MVEQNSESHRAADGTLLATVLGALSNNRRIDELLEGQIALNRLQIEDMKREDRVRHWSLRVRHVSDVLKLALELAAAAVVTAIAVFIGGAAWSAAHDDGLVIESFNVPADMAANGLTGQVIATQLQDRLSFMQAHTETMRAASTYRSNFGDDIKVQIPDTGISIGEFYRYLVAWLGHQTHIMGEVWHAPEGISLSVRSGTNPAHVFVAGQAGLTQLVGEAAEQVYSDTQPYRYSVYLGGQNRTAEYVRVLRALTLHGAPDERPWANSRWGLYLLSVGDVAGALDKQRTAVALNPDLPHIWGNLGGVEAYYGHDEAVLHAIDRVQPLLDHPAAASQLGTLAVEATRFGDSACRAEMLGDYREAIAQDGRLATLPEVYSGSDISAAVMMSADYANDHDLAASQRADSESTGERASLAAFSKTTTVYYTPPLPSLARAVAREDWRSARDDLIRLQSWPEARHPAIAPILPIAVWPWVAYAEARLGDFAAARVLIDKTPLDCYLCVRMRARIDSAQGKWNGAAFWFANAAAQGPSFPFAHLEWGEMLLRKGDYNGAITKFASAHAKGPHFADPLEMWGEALIQKDRSDLALAKFEEADKYAPNWGRLHLKWGEALWWTGDKAGAQKQFDDAGRLGLSGADKAALAVWRTKRV